MLKRVLAVLVLGAIAVALPVLRRALIRDVVTWDAAPSEPALLPNGDGPGLSPVPRVRVVLIDGLSAPVAHALPAWSALCARGIRMTMDVGFPTVSLPVETELWTGLTQQQTGIVGRSDRPLVPPLDKRGIPAQVAGSRAIAEDHAWIVRSLGFAQVEPEKDDDPSYDFAARAKVAVASAAPLVFVHVLRVDTAGHKFGGASPEYKAIALEADKLLDTLLAADPGARWFVLSDHGHLPEGGHGGEEQSVRQVESCVAGPGIARATATLVHAVDVAKALADSTGAKLDRDARGRPMSVALVSPLTGDQALPPEPLGAGALGIFCLVIGLVASSWAVRQWWLVPWWFPLACASLVALRGEPTLSMHMVYAPTGRDMYLTWLPALGLCALATYAGLGKTTISRVIVGQLALPFAAAAAAITASGAWGAVFGEEIAPVVPRFTAWLSPLILLAALGAAAVALGALGRIARQVFGRRAPAAPTRTPKPAA